MRTLIDTNVAIALANGVGRIVDPVAQLPAAPLPSVVSRVELEGGVYANPAVQQAHRALLDAVLATMNVRDFRDVPGLAVEDRAA